MNATTITATNILVSQIPSNLQGQFRRLRSTKRKVRVIVVNDDSFRVTTYNLRWDGGTRNVYYTAPIQTMELVQATVGEDSRYAVPRGSIVVEVSHFQGLECDPTVYVVREDLVKFYGVDIPKVNEDLQFAPEIAADWMTDQADEKGSGREAKKEAKALRNAAEMIRKLAGF